jgi:hypothetical protein
LSQHHARQLSVKQELVSSCLLARDLELLIQASTHRGRLIMNTIEKFATAAVALAITLVGAVLVIAPLVISGPRPMM